MKWVGLTGGIACGKSTVSKNLAKRRVPIVDADEIAREVVKLGSLGLAKIAQDFGPDFLNQDGTLNRRKLGQHIFGKQELRERLEAILHPLIREEVQRRRKDLEDQGELLAVYDIPLLFESQAQGQFDKIIVVSCDKTQQEERLRKLNWSEKEIQERIASQMPLEIKEKGADFVVRNNGDQQHLLGEVDRLMAWLEELKNQK